MPDTAPYITDSKIRTSLLRRVRVFCAKTKTLPWRIGQEVLNDPGFVRRVEDGQNFTVASYMRVQKYLDTKLKRPAASKKNGTTTNKRRRA